MIHLTETERHIVQNILQKILPEAHVVVFGSRVTGKLKPFSDLDLAVNNKKPLSLEQLSKLKDAFSESNLPFRVDVVDMQTVSGEFLDVIKKQCEPIQQ